jgi:hypothetical protein
MINIFDHINSSKTFSRNRSSRNLFFEKCYNRATAFEEFVGDVYVYLVIDHFPSYVSQETNMKNNYVVISEIRVFLISTYITC